jgi:hypothetical protein
MVLFPEQDKVRLMIMVRGTLSVLICVCLNSRRGFIDKCPTPLA